MSKLHDLTNTVDSIPSHVAGKSTEPLVSSLNTLIETLQSLDTMQQEGDGELIIVTIASGSRVFLHSTPSLGPENRIGLYDAGTPMIVLAVLWQYDEHDSESEGRGYYWIKVRMPDGTEGWIREDNVAFGGADLSGFLIDPASDNPDVVTPLNTNPITNTELPLPPGFTLSHLVRIQGTDLYSLTLETFNSPILVTVYLDERGNMQVRIPISVYGDWKQIDVPKVTAPEGSAEWEAQNKARQDALQSIRDIQAQNAYLSLIISWQIEHPDRPVPTVGDLMAIVTMGEAGNVYNRTEFIQQAIIRNTFDLDAGACRSEADPPNCAYEDVVQYFSDIQFLYSSTDKSTNDYWSETQITESRGLLPNTTDVEGLKQDIEFSRAYYTMANLMSRNENWWSGAARGQGDVPSVWGNIALAGNFSTSSGEYDKARAESVIKAMSRNPANAVIFFSDFANPHRGVVKVRNDAGECVDCTEIFAVVNSDGRFPPSNCHADQSCS